MKKTIALLILNLILVPLTVNAGLDKLIQQNVRDADKSYEQIISTVEQSHMPSRLWILLQSESQRSLAEKIYTQVSYVNLPEIRIERKPLQFVNSGLRVSQLRYFKKEDRPEVQELLEALRLLIPDLVLEDLSNQYSHSSWIKRGHYELWLSVKMGDTPPTR